MIEEQTTLSKSIKNNNNPNSEEKIFQHEQSTSVLVKEMKYKPKAEDYILRVDFRTIKLLKEERTSVRKLYYLNKREGVF